MVGTASVATADMAAITDKVMMSTATAEVRPLRLASSGTQLSKPDRNGLIPATMRTVRGASRP